MNDPLSRFQGMLSPEQSMNIVLEAINEAIDYELAVVLSLEQDNQLRVRQARGPLVTPELRNYSIDLEKRSDLLEILHQGHVRLLDDQAEQGIFHVDTYHDILDLPENHSCLVAPLSLNNQTVGLLTLDHRVCDRFTPNIIKTVASLSRLIAIALAQSRSVDALNAERDLLLAERNALLGDNLPENRLIGRSASWLIVLKKIRMVAVTDTPVLLTGETGTGKEEAARALHQLSPRRNKPFVALNCSALSSALAESELFGHEKGAFTGAHSRRRGRFELADGGTLFLDEIGDLPLEIQPKLLRALQDQKFERLGSEETISADVRILCATHIDLKEAIRNGRFREDLYYRLNVFPIELPPLRQRPDDILLLTAHFLKKLALKLNRPPFLLSPPAAAFLHRHSWPGNIRELQNVLERAAILTPGLRIDREVLDADFEPVGPEAGAEISSLRNEPILALEEMIKKHILKTLEHTRGRIYGAGGAAELLRVKPTTLQSKIRKLGIR